MPYLLLAIFPFFFFGGPGYHGSRSFVAAWDLGHILFFVLVTSALCRKFPVLSAARKKNIIFVLVLIMGITIELLQSGFDGRSASIYDVLRNQLGCFLGLLFFCPGGHNAQPKRSLFFLRLLAFFLITITLTPLLRGLTDEITAKLQFPLLAGFETPLEMSRWKGKCKITLQKEIARDGRYSMQVNLTRDKYSGVSLFYFPRNWQDYQLLGFSVYNPEEEMFRLVCRVNDRHHNNEYTDRFNRSFVLQLGWNDIFIPLQDIKDAPTGRLMDMKNIRNIGFFVVRQQKKRTIYLDSVQLLQVTSEAALFQMKE